MHTVNRGVKPKKKNINEEIRKKKIRKNILALDMQFLQAL